MRDILKALRTDHANFHKVLDVLKENLKILQAGNQPDYTLMLDCMDYLDQYADLYHHPREDVIYEFYLERHAGERAVFAELMRDHHALRFHTARLRDILRGLLNDAMVSKTELMAYLLEFIDRQHRHLDTEESAVFPLLAQALSERDGRHVEWIVPTRPDPLFGAQVADNYAALYERITAMS